MTDGDSSPSPARSLAAVRDRVTAVDGAWTLALAAFAGVLVFLTSVVVFPYHSTNHDEAVYLQQAAMLLEGRLFLRPPVVDAFRPWFFVRDGGALYSKYTPVTAGVFALGKALTGSYRVALGLVAAGNVALTVVLGTDAFDRRTGLFAGALLLVSPLFVVSSSVFLSYAPATLFNLAFAVAYVRAERARTAASASASGSAGASGTGGVLGTAGTRRRTWAWAAVAGFAIGLAVFTRPYTAVLFALPFVAHAAGRIFLQRSRSALAANLVTAGVAFAWIAVALAYNAVVTGDALTFPYQAFAPQDGLGFGTREILNYSREYTPALAVRANAEVVARLFARWVPLGIAGTVLAAWGVRRGLSRPAGTAENAIAAVRDVLSREELAAYDVRVLLASLYATVVVGNVFFWGNLNVLGALDVVADGLVWTLGPYYHFDLLVPTAVFAAWGARDAVSRVRDVHAAVSGPRRRAVQAAAVVVVLLVVTVGVGALAHPVGGNYVTSQHLADAYDVDREYDDAVVFLPQAYGDWLNHPFQVYRNDPGYDGDVVYALDRGGGNFEVAEAFANRSLYRYTYRGQWAPFDAESVEPRVQAVTVTRGERVGVDVSLGTPSWTERAAVELTAENSSVAYYVTDLEDGVDVRLVVADGRARLVGADVEPQRGNGSVPVAAADTVTVSAFLGSQGSSGLTYRLETPVRAGSGDAPSAVMTPVVETCVTYGTCGGAAAYIPETAGPGVSVDVAVWSNATGDVEVPSNSTDERDGPSNTTGRVDVVARADR